MQTRLRTDFYQRKSTETGALVHSINVGYEMNRTTTFYQQIEIDLSEVTYATYVLRPMTSQKILTNQISRPRLKIFDWQATPHVTLVMTG